MIVVTGATGKLGSLVVDRLLERVPAETVGVSVRDPAKAASLAARGVRVRAGDFTDPASLKEAFEGADRVLVISAAIRGAGAAAANIAAIDAARGAGAGRIVYTSHQAASRDSLFLPMHTHAATEAHLLAQDTPFTSLRNGFYASTVDQHLGSVLPEDGPVSWTAHADLADAAVAALTEDVLDGITPPLTAPVTRTFAELAAEQGIEHVTLPDDEWLAAAVERGTPAPLAEFTLGMFRAARRGEFAVTDPTLEKVIGRTPQVR
jgi:NAD(P)H dehydrogenase (quinone)